ncbi:hypothetical protein [Methylibium sp.]|jgi:hypothetical protein|uniref:hypothetical protein n=1 Tax=Methylibium sp. TaxID=2067992 RepID=UPI003D101B60
MCNSAQIIDRYKQYVRHWGAKMSIAEFAELYSFSFKDRRNIQKLMNLLFADPETWDEQPLPQ